VNGTYSQASHSRACVHDASEQTQRVEKLGNYAIFRAVIQEAFRGENSRK
jgi:hypothetical protein